MASITNALVTVSQLDKPTLNSSPTPTDLDVFTSSLLSTSQLASSSVSHSPVIATSIVLLQRCLLARLQRSLYLIQPQLNPYTTLSQPPLSTSTAKLSSTPVSTRNIVNVYAFLTNTQSSPLLFINHFRYDQITGTANSTRVVLLRLRRHLRTPTPNFSSTTKRPCSHQLAFNTHVALPYTLASDVPVRSWAMLRTIQLTDKGAGASQQRTSISAITVSHTSTKRTCCGSDIPCS